MYSLAHTKQADFRERSFETPHWCYLMNPTFFRSNIDRCGTRRHKTSLFGVLWSARGNGASSSSHMRLVFAFYALGCMKSFGSFKARACFASFDDHFLSCISCSALNEGMCFVLISPSFWVHWT
jgi:hypothetical protein